MVGSNDEIAPVQPDDLAHVAWRHDAIVDSVRALVENGANGRSWPALPRH